MEYIVKLDSLENLDNFVQQDFIEVENIMRNLLRVSFKIDEKSGFTLDEVNSLKGVLKISENIVLSLSEPTKKKIEANLNASSVNNFNSILAEIGGETEYLTHLELLNSRNYSSYESTGEFSTTKTGNNVDVFVCDTGIFSNNHFFNDGQVNPIPDYKDPYNVENNHEDDNGHGTLVALLIGANKFGVAKQVNLYSVKVLNVDQTGSINTIVNALDKIVAFHNAKTNNIPTIVNMSLGVEPSGNNTNIELDQTESGDNFYLDAIKDVANEGIHVVMAAGNGFNVTEKTETYLEGPMLSRYGNGSLNLPPSENFNTDEGQGNVIVVGSTDSASSWLDGDHNLMSSFSNYGKGNTINAVGGKLAMPDYNITSTNGSNNLTETNGTSFSAPVVTGLLALHLQDNPSITPAEAKAWIKSTATQNQITNLMSYKEYIPGRISTDFSWADNKLTIKQLKTDFSYFNENDIIQIDFQITNQTFNDFESALNEVNDGWYKVVEVSTDLIGSTKSKLVITPNVTASYDNISLNYFGATTTLKIAKINGTHEETDGVKIWQKKNSENRLSYCSNVSNPNTCTDFYLTNVEETENLVAFNPYQDYTINWSSVNKLDLSAENDQLQKIVFETNRGEVPFATKFSVEQLPESVTLSENGVFTKADNYTSQENYSDIQLTAFHDYASSETITLSVIDSSFEVIANNLK